MRRQFELGGFLHEFSPLSRIECGNSTEFEECQILAHKRCNPNYSCEATPQFDEAYRIVVNRPDGQSRFAKALSSGVLFVLIKT